MGWASRPPVIKGAHVAHPTRLYSLFIGNPNGIKHLPDKLLGR
ncbi:hypothetical protein GXM_00714 [Nostoc sphaeroides CCNUC1]|uniref:Uncharacterized protein n=1 Tax=Nostoc sphaeroides CCNUC1 TaxID=2653204 RepID=A0A5P8VSF1_9NOSO|nr:hypothetical protein GXM_00714 [Nostoc sphaeroides CCNUC1]